MNQPKILIVEDNQIIALDIKNTLTQLGYQVTDTVYKESDIFKSINQNEPCMILMDISLGQEKDGIDIVKDIHKNKFIPVIYLTGEENDKIINKALDTCPIGYLTKPYRATELKSTIKIALCKKQTDNHFKSLGCDYSFDITNKKLYYKGEIQKLSTKETQFLELLIEANGEVVLFETIENIIWENQSVTNDAIRLLVSRLRKKLKCIIIETIYSYGFKLYTN